MELNYTITDPDGGNLSIVPMTGEDALYVGASFTGFGSTLSGTVSLRMPDNMATDFEWPFDANQDNTYVAQFGATDGVNITRRELRFTVTNATGAAVVTRVATGFVEPVALTSASNNDYIGASDTVVAERTGRIFHVKDNGATGARTLLIDLGPEISIQPGMGILNVLLEPGPFWGPQYEPRDLLVLLTNLQGDIELRRYLVLDGYTGVEVPVLAIDFLILRAAAQPGVTGNPGGLLKSIGDAVYVGIGDGGGLGDPGGHAQNPASMRGKILRIRTNGDGLPSDPDRNFGIPPSNPNVSGIPREVVAMGVRNPVQGSYDFKGQALLFVDAGEQSIEEVNRLQRLSPEVLNFGWPLRQGLSAYNGGADSASFSAPVAVYAPGLSTQRRMNGAVAYHGGAESFQAEFFFGDPVNGRVWSFPFRNVDTAPAAATFIDRTAVLTPNVGRIDSPVAIVADVYNDMLILDGDGEIFRYHPAS